MPTFLQGSAKPPSDTTRGLDDQLLFGLQQWQPCWAAWARQWSQPQLIKLSAATLGCRAIHSSSINGWITGTLRDATPKLITAVGLFNEAVARSNGVEGLPDGRVCPGALEGLWRGYQWMVDPEGRPLNPTSTFLAITGAIDLGLADSLRIPMERESEVLRALGRHLRLSLGAEGVDWMSDLHHLRGGSRSLEALLLGKAIPWEVVAAELPLLASICHTSEMALRGVVDDALYNGAS